MNSDWLSLVDMIKSISEIKNEKVKLHGMRDMEEGLLRRRGLLDRDTVEESIKQLTDRLHKLEDAKNGIEEEANKLLYNVPGDDTGVTSDSEASQTAGEPTAKSGPLLECKAFQKMTNLNRTIGMDTSLEELEQMCSWRWQVSDVFFGLEDPRTNAYYHSTLEWPDLDYAKCACQECHLSNNSCSQDVDAKDYKGHYAPYCEQCFWEHRTSLPYALIRMTAVARAVSAWLTLKKRTGTTKSIQLHGIRDGLFIVTVWGRYRQDRGDETALFMLHDVKHIGWRGTLKDESDSRGSIQPSDFFLEAICHTLDKVC